MNEQTLSLDHLEKDLVKERDKKTYDKIEPELPKQINPSEVLKRKSIEHIKKMRASPIMESYINHT